MNVTLPPSSPPSSPPSGPPPGAQPPAPQPDPSQPGLSQPGPGEPPSARTRRSRISLFWLIPLVAAGIAAFLGYRDLKARGPTIEVTFRTADGLAAGQTKVRHKAVQLGSVEGIRLSDDMSRVVVSVRMTREATPYLTDHARFWVVRPRFNSGNISGIETLVSGGYIEMDPGGRDGTSQRSFTGLEQPPGVRSDEPGRTFTLKAERIGALGVGSPVFYRDITVGEVLGHDIGDGNGPVTMQVFVRAPYDDYVRRGTNFWNASGLTLHIGSEGVRVEVASLQAVLSGGVAFETPGGSHSAAPVDSNTEFKLYPNQAEAKASAYTASLSFVAYFESSVRGLAADAPVEFYGIQVGVVRDVKLEVDKERGTARVRVQFDVQPGRIVSPEEAARNDPAEITRRLLARGLRAQLSTANFLTGQLLVALDMPKDASSSAGSELRKEGDAIVLPTGGGGIDNILTAANGLAEKLSRLNVDEIGANLNAALRQATGTLGGVDALVRNTDSNLAPALRRLPEVAAGLQDTVLRANRLIASLDGGYGRNSNFSRELERALINVGDTARSVRQLADFLDRHPEALVRGRAGATR